MSFNLFKDIIIEETDHEFLAESEKDLVKSFVKKVIDSYEPPKTSEHVTWFHLNGKTYEIHDKLSPSEVRGYFEISPSGQAASFPWMTEFALRTGLAKGYNYGVHTGWAKTKSWFTKRGITEDEYWATKGLLNATKEQRIEYQKLMDKLLNSKPGEYNTETTKAINKLKREVKKNVT